MISCLELGTQAISWNEVTNKVEPQGNYHFLDESGVKVFIPQEFSKKSISDFQTIAKELYTEELANSEINRINQLKDFEGELYLFFDDVTKASISVNTLPYQPMSKQDAKFFLGMLRQQMERNVQGQPVVITKVASQYEGTVENYVFKYIYKFSNSEEGFEHYNTAYLITKNSKSVFINLNAGFNAYYDPFALKTVI